MILVSDQHVLYVQVCHFWLSYSVHIRNLRAVRMKMEEERSTVYVKERLLRNKSQESLECATHE